MSKSFDAETVQRTAHEKAASMSFGFWRHYKGGIYRVLDVVVDEATGNLLVSYMSDDKLYRWSRPLTVFLETMSDGQNRFQRWVKNP